MNNDNIALVLDELAHAKEKHPKFVDYFMTNRIGTEVDLQCSRVILRGEQYLGHVAFADVLQCELDEAFDAYAHGDLAHARQELAQCAAICIRGIEYVQSEIDKQNTKQPTTTQGETTP